MPRERIPLADIVEFLDDQELRLRVSLNFWSRQNPDQPAPQQWARQPQMMMTAADTLRIMATYEDKSRAFVAQLMKDYAEGRWP